MTSGGTKISTVMTTTIDTMRISTSGKASVVLVHQPAYLGSGTAGTAYTFFSAV